MLIMIIMNINFNFNLSVIVIVSNCNNDIFMYVYEGFGIVSLKCNKPHSGFRRPPMIMYNNLWLSIEYLTLLESGFIFSFV